VSDPLGSQANRPVYVERVNAVIDYIETHLDDDLTVEKLAEVAHFSPFHFHRIFSVMTGETLGQFIGRLRLERAATWLIGQRDRPVTEIAVECGFASPSAFSRAFRETFGMTPSAWRAGGHAGYERQSRKPNDDPSVESLARSGRFGVEGTRLSVQSGRTVWDIGAGSLGTASVEIEQLTETDVAYVRYTGRYQGLGEVFTDLFTRLMTWAEPRGLVAPGTPLLSVYHDDPGITDDDRLRVSVCVPVPADMPAEGDIGRMTIPGGACAVGHFELGITDYPAAWYALAGGWLPDSGYEPDDRLPFERFIVGREARRPDAEPVDICIPVRPLRRY